MLVLRLAIVILQRICLCGRLLPTMWSDHIRFSSKQFDVPGSMAAWQVAKKALVLPTPLPPIGQKAFICEGDSKRKLRVLQMFLDFYRHFPTDCLPILIFLFSDVILGKVMSTSTPQLKELLVIWSGECWRIGAGRRFLAQRIHVVMFWKRYTCI